MKTVDIKGNAYVPVNERIKRFRETFAGYALTTEIIQLDETRVIMKANVINPDGIVVSDGIAYEDANSSFINKSSYIENCQTSAAGRALGNFGIGVDSSVASADEVLNAINNQNKHYKQSDIAISWASSNEEIKSFCSKNKLTSNEIKQFYGTSGGDPTLFIKEAEKYMEELKQDGWTN